MIITNLKGGLGNQMFQYACGRALALRQRDKLSIVRSEYQGDITRPFSLTNFNIKAELMPADNVPLWPRLMTRWRQKITRDFEVGFNPSVLHRRGRVYLDGYFQSEKYFIDHEETIKKDFQLAVPLTGHKLQVANMISNDVNAVSLHVRRGDYVNHPDFGGVVTKEYYARAIAHIRQLVPTAKFYVFSDDIAWCQNELPLQGNATFVSDPELKDYEELTLMSLAKHHIIANSSFSWWGAWLGKNPHKTVVAPTRWSNLHEHWYRDIIPATWTRL